MIKTKNRGLFIVISGPSGAGKGTVCKGLVKANPNVWLSVSATTREKRPDEKNGENYFFLTKDEFIDKIEAGEFLEYAIVHDNQYYGTPKEKINEHLTKGKDVILEIDIKGALQIQDNIPNSLFIFILPPSMKELKRRLISRGTESKEKMIERFKASYKEINEITKYNYVVVNDNIEDAIKKINAIMVAEKCRVDRIEDVALNNLEEEIHENLVDTK
ncbi:MAG: guanylate kinase [Bacilli bacterium]|nr:guanylate kinase [Bacilli bacterium]MDD3305365.1 guanylate kinase [Bacilli bacterium]MDD4054048.1 guanylate kinase [Bacilli bacterium]MDD4411820.1 guanylate kinase [Bacilli bacterium]